MKAHSLRRERSAAEGLVRLHEMAADSDMSSHGFPYDAPLYYPPPPPAKGSGFRVLGLGFRV